MSIDELRAWQAFDHIDPIGGYRGDLQSAIIAQQIAVWSGHCKELPPLKDFLAVDPNPMTPEQRAAVDAQAAKAQSDAYVEALIASMQRRSKNK